MTTTRDDLITRLWRGSDPFRNVVAAPDRVDIQGWGGSHHVWFGEMIASLRPNLIVEIGVWKGASTIHMAGLLRLHQIPGVVVAVDTWLGSSDHWLDDQWFAALDLQSGRPTLQSTFMNNVVSQGLQEHVLPLALDSVNAAQVVSHLRLPIDMLHIDAGHDMQSVMTDLLVWWPLLRAGGVLIGDDYHAVWPGVRAAFDNFIADNKLSFEVADAKIRMVKPGS